MPWGRLDDRANGDAKLAALSDAAFRLWAYGVIYCNAYLTDGFIPADIVSTFPLKSRNRSAAVTELCSRLVPKKGPLWHRARGGFRVHDYLDWNDPKEKIVKQREANCHRVKKFRENVKRKRNALRNGSETAEKRAPTTTPTTTGVSTDQKHSIGRVFSGSRLKVSRRQHEVVCDELGTMAGHIDILSCYERWNQDLEASGEDFDTLPYIKHRAAEEVKAIRRGGPLYAAPTVNDQGEDWFAECQRLHDRRCNGRVGHETQLAIDRARAQERQPA